MTNYYNICATYKTEMTKCITDLTNEYAELDKMSNLYSEMTSCGSKWTYLRF